MTNADQEASKNDLTSLLMRAKEARSQAVREMQNEADKLFVDAIRSIMRKHQITVTEVASITDMSRTNMHRLLAKYPEKEGS